MASPEARSTSIAQTPDGYLWLGTEFGLASIRWRASGAVAAAAGVSRCRRTTSRSLLAARDGALWIGTAEGLASWKDGRLTGLSRSSRAHAIGKLVEDRQNTYGPAPSSVPTGRSVRIRSAVKCSGTTAAWVGVFALFEDGSGTLWVGRGTGCGDGRPVRPRSLMPGDAERHPGCVRIATAPC